jgi:hypothetical protein
MRRVAIGFIVNGLFSHALCCLFTKMYPQQGSVEFWLRFFPLTTLR